MGSGGRLSGILLNVHKVVLPLYSFTNRLGLLELPWVDRLFVGSYFLYKDWMEDPFTPLVRRRPDLFSGGHILDVGANVGYTACLFASVLSPGFRLFAFEPEERNFSRLRTSVASRGFTGRIVPVRAAVGNTEGKADLWLNPAHGADHRLMTPSFGKELESRGDVQRVPVIRIDDYCAREALGSAIRFIKIDVQGVEELVCRGMVETLRQNPGAWIGLEYYPEGIKQMGLDPLNILRFFEEKGYAAFSLTRRDGLRAVQYAQVPTIVGPKGYMDLAFSKSPHFLDRPPLKP